MSSSAEPVRTIAPPVVAVVVAHDPGPWFDDTLESLAVQDYPSLSVVIIDAASRIDPSARVHSVLPNALVRRVKTNDGYGNASNEILRLVEGAAFFLLCHDDIALEPSALRMLVEEAYRSNAGVCGPKQLEWDDSSRLVSVGVDVDRVGHGLSSCERGELDQEQHDAVRDVFVVAGGCQLVRADLFTKLGGFDPTITFWGDDLDLCWRAHVAGARVLVVPGARVRHRAALSDRRPDLDQISLTARHRRYVQRSTSSLAHRMRTVPIAALGTISEIVGPVLTGHIGRARAGFGALVWSYRNGGPLRRRRAAIAELRAVSDGEVANLQISSIDRFRRAVRTSGETDERFGAINRFVGRLTDRVRGDQHRVARNLSLVLALLLVLASRDLIRHGVPAVGEFGQFRRSALSQLRDYTDGLLANGVAPTGTPSTGVGFIGLISLICGGALGLARTVSLLGPLVLGWVGVWSLSRSFGRPTARAVAVIAYVMNPLPYNAIAQGHWGALVVYGCLPWMIAPVLAASEWPGPIPGGVACRFAARAGLAAAVAFAFEPLSLAVFGFMVLCVAAAQMTDRHRGGASSIVTVGLGAVVTAFVVNLPWSLTLVREATWSAIGGVKPASPGGLDALDVLRFATGPVGAGIAGLALLAPGVFALVVARAERLSAATLWWVVAAGSFGVTLLSQRGVIERPLGPSELTLAPAALALAMLAGLAVVTFAHDVSGTNFGVQQPFGFVCLAAGLFALAPPLAALADGRFDMPRRDFDPTLALLDQGGSARTLWLGSPSSLPVGGWWLTDGLAWAITDRPATDAANRWAGSPSDADLQVKQALDFAGAGDTTRLGRLVGPLGVRYIVVTQRSGPTLGGASESAVPTAVTDMLAAQLDMQRIDIDDALVVYQNTSWIPVRSGLSTGALQASSAAGAGSLVTAELSGSVPLLTSAGRRFIGPVPAGTSLYLAYPLDDRWEVTLDGEIVDPVPAFGWSATYPINVGGEIIIERSVDWGRRALVAGQAVLWIAVVIVARHTSPRGRHRKSMMIDAGGSATGLIEALAVERQSTLPTEIGPDAGWGALADEDSDGSLDPWGAVVSVPDDPMWDEAANEDTGEILSAWHDDGGE